MTTEKAEEHISKDDAIDNSGNLKKDTLRDSEDKYIDWDYICENNANDYDL